MNQNLRDICTEFGKDVVGPTHKGTDVDGGRLLYAISGCESGFGMHREFVRHEPAYMPGGKYYLISATLRSQWARFGILAASSFGSVQIMFSTAVEMGFSGLPIGLQEDRTSVYWAAQLIAKRFILQQHAKTLSDVLDAYNSGAVGDRFVPAVYIAQGIKYYENPQ